MPGLFQALEIGKRAILTHQVSLQTLGHNIANVNTPGYTRQRVDITNTFPEESAFGSVGTGVRVSNIRHIRDLFLGNQYRQENKSLGQWSYKEKTLRQVEELFGEPNDNALSDQLNKFFASWNDLAHNPDTRNSVLSEACLLVNRFHELANQLTTLQSSIDREMVTVTREINGLANEIARLNHEIKRSEVGAATANDLRDMRDLLIDKLSTLVDVNTRDEEYGVVVVMVGSMQLVDDNHALQIGVEIANDNGSLKHNLMWQGTKIPFNNLDGRLKGLVDSRDEIIPRHLEQLNALTRTLVEEVNTLHRSGYGLDGSTGTNFFAPQYTDATTIEVNSNIVSKPSMIAAAQVPDAESDNRIALAIAALQDAKLMNDNATTINGFYSSLVGSLGVETREAQSFTESYEMLVAQIDNARQSVQGVSLDEELANMVKSQHAYDAAARVITAMDQALDTVIFKMGVIGR
ncbi:MAG: flagellar hook-associated protein FlgK [candidate division Zixibacteria bacterium]|nr:flagellar hook-associated protein FlgK [candidate division Zixibacteria bacterium]